MISLLRLKNIALIKSAEIEFDKNLNVLSGETGAGKSVIINAINFALGQKADKTLIRYGEDFCEAEIVFDTQNSLETLNVLEEYGIDVDNNEVIIRRRLTSEGKSTILINGVHVTLAMLKNVTLTLCDIYGQSEHYSLLNKKNQLKVLDDYIGEEVNAIKEQILPLIANIKKNNDLLSSFGIDESSKEIKLDLLSYQIKEIEDAELKDGEEEDLENRLKILRNIEKIGESLSIVKSILGDDNLTIDLISTSLNKLSNITDYSENYSNIYDRLYSSKAEIDDIYSEVTNLLEDLEYDENESNFVNTRLDLYRTLKRKYGSNYNEILSYYNNLKLEYDNLLNFEEKSKQILKEIESDYIKLEGLYKRLTLLRTNKAKEFSKNIENELKTLGMKSAKFEVLFQTSENKRELSTNGIDDIEFTFSANAGEPLKTMSKIISGGEMSRFMLSLKLVSTDKSGTYIFDEIDSGISGDVAKIVAEKFAIISKKIQIITISHLPQIVSFGDSSFKIEKIDDGNNTITNVIKLDENGKISEIVRLIGGDNSSSSITHAKNLISSANDYKKSI